MKCTFMSLSLMLLLGQSTGHAAELTPAEQKIVEARTAIDKYPQRHENYARLAVALTQRARESSDTTYYAAAEKAVAQSLERAPGNLDARRAAIGVMLGRHEFADALKAGLALARDVPDDLQAYAYLTDAQVELGHYGDAEKSAQWLLNLRPGNTPGLTRAAYLRELFGDIDGSLDLMQQAYQRTPPTHHEDRAWILTHMAHLRLLNAEVGDADLLTTEALQIFPGYHYALAQQAKVRQAQGRWSDAVALLRRHVETAPHPENFFYLGEALAHQQRMQEAEAVFDDFEAAARAESASWDNANRELILYYADYAHRPGKALKLAEFEIARRQDVFTLDAYAWALYRNGKFRQADTVMSRALATGVRDPTLHYHAGMIALKRGTAARARVHLQTALRYAPWAVFAADARAAIRHTTKTRQPA
ncbi:MAG: tetratricopeptide repeat protein [Thiobacillus sp.]|nr:tetratricopeptide repeat protein [Thiobacillus sp.]